MQNKIIYEKTDNFYNQKIYLSNIREYRFDFFKRICQGKKVMHIGCADSMVFDPDSNLHIYLSNSNTANTIHGMDIDAETIQKLSEVCPGKYFTSYSEIDEKYDMVLIPEVMEHVPNVHLFLQDIFSISSKEYLFTVPSMKVAQLFCDDTFALEMVHPDHKYWFSPYTLYNIMKPFSNGYNIHMYYLENKSQIGIRIYDNTIDEETIV